MRIVGAVLPYPEINLEHVLVRSPSGVTGTSALMQDTAEGLRAGSAPTG